MSLNFFFIVSNLNTILFLLLRFSVNGETQNEETEKDKSGVKSDGEEEDDDDDNINVVIGDIRTTPSYAAGSNLHIKRGNLLTLTKVSKY